MRHADDNLVTEASELIAYEWEVFQERDDHYEVTKYYNEMVDSHDYFSYNARLLFAKATINFLTKGALDPAYFRYVLPIVEDVAKQISLNKGFYKPPQNLYVQFWEHYQAMDMLCAFLKVVNNVSGLSKEAYVLVNPVHFHKHAFKIEPNLGVVLMPLTKDWSNDVLNAFKDTLTAKRFECWRADMEHRDDNLMQTIWENINKARFIIADCTGQNPNVFYELGIADVIGKPIFRCAQARIDFPFDIAAIRSYVYGVRVSQIEDLKRELGAFIEGLSKA